MVPGDGATHTREELRVKQIRSFDLGRAALYGAVLAAFWTFAFGVYFWIIAWIAGSASWLVDMNLGIWIEGTLEAGLQILWRMIVNGIGGAFAGFFVALVYNAVAGMMGGLAINLEDKK